MFQKFEAARNVYANVDRDGATRELLHTHAPVMSRARTPQLAAAEYLQSFGDLFGLLPDQLKSLWQSPSLTVEGGAPVEFRFDREKALLDGVTVGFDQTVLGLPVWEAGIAVRLLLDPLRVVSAQSTHHRGVEIQAPPPYAVTRAESIDTQTLAASLGLTEHHGDASAWDPGSLRIAARRLVVFRYEAARRTTAPAKTVEHVKDAGPPTLPLPQVPTTIVDGRHYVCVKVDFSLRHRAMGVVNWVAIVEVESMVVLYLRAFVDHVNGLVFDCDPVTDSGGPAPSATSMALNPVRVSVALPGLAAPVAGTQSLTGDTIQMADPEAPNIASPTEPTGTNFDFDARTNDFAAVNAYYHCDRFFRLLDGMGFTHAGFLGGTTFPTPVDHRGTISAPTGGIEINAHCLGTSGGTGIMQTTFALADTGDTTHPIGIACDYRVVLHELGGHGVLYNHVSSANLGFSHSAGDSVAAILNDPGTHATDRFLSFPWISGVIARRHDRTPAGGWGYAGSIALNPFDLGLDRGGYNNEQILSSAHFRLYRSIGGDSADLAMQRFAARMTVYLIMRAIASLTPSTNPGNASGWVTALQSADLGDWVSENITGGAYSKVIRWAFEKQGLFQPAGATTPNNNEGAPPAVDVYIDDGRAGEYPFQPVWWNCQNIWNRRAADGLTTHEEPITNQTNYAYVKIKNRGTQTATGVVVKAFSANPAGGLSYPIDWTPMTTAQLSAANVPPNSATEITVGPFAWVPKHVGHECMFVVVSATGDASNTDNIKPGDSIPEWRLIPNDNNCGQRNVFPISGGGTSGLVKDFNRLTFQLKNPHHDAARAEVRAVLPPFLERRGWKVAFVNPGGAAFPLRPGEAREIHTQLVPGADFSANDVPVGDERTIHLIARVGNIVVGGMSYDIDPTLAPPADPAHHGDGCTEPAEALIQCVQLPRDRVRKVHVRRITIDVEFKDECDD